MTKLHNQAIEPVLEALQDRVLGNIQRQSYDGVFEISAPWYAGDEDQDNDLIRFCKAQKLGLLWLHLRYDQVDADIQESRIFISADHRLLEQIEHQMTCEPISESGEYPGCYDEDDSWTYGWYLVPTCTHFQPPTKEALWHQAWHNLGQILKDQPNGRAKAEAIRRDIIAQDQRLKPQENQHGKV